MTTPKDIKTDNSQTIKDKSKETTTSVIQDNAKINKDLASHNSSQLGETTSQAAQEITGSPESRNISYQILAEPLRAISPESIINSIIAGVTTLTQGLLEQIPDKVETASQLSQDPASTNNAQLKNCVKGAAAKCTTIAQTEANHAQLANGHELKATFASQTIAANSIRLNSDTTISYRSPHINTNTQDFHLQSNNSIIFVSDVKVDNYKQEASFIEGTSLKQAQNGLRIFTEISDTVSKFNRSIGVENHTVMGKENNLIADSKLTSVSGGDIQTAAYGNIGMQGNGDISIVAAKSNNPVPVGASSEKELATFDYGGNVYILSKTSVSSTNIMGFTSGGIFSSSSGDVLTNSSGLFVASSSNGSIVSSDKFSYVGTPLSGVFVKGRRMFLGKVPIPVVKVNKPNVVEVPSLPKLPSLPSQDLKNCIPKKKEKEEDPELPIFTLTRDIDQENATTNDTSSSQSSTSTSTTTNGSVPVKPDITTNKVTLDNRREVAKVVSPNPSTTQSSNPNSSRLPPPTSGLTTATSSNATSTVPQIAAIDAAGLLGGPPGVYVDIYKTEATSDVLDLITPQDLFTFNSLIDFVDSDNISDSIASSLTIAEDLINQDSLTKTFSSLIPKELLTTFTYVEFFIDLLDVPLDKIKTFQLTLEDFTKADKDKVQSILEIIKQYPALKDSILEYFEKITALEGIGFLAALSKIGIDIDSDIVKDIAKIPKIIDNKDINEVIKLSKPYLTQVIKGSTFEKLLENPDVLEIGDLLLKGKPVSSKLLKEKVDKIYNAEIKSILEKEFRNLLGSDLEELLPSIKDILYKIKVGQTIKPEDYVDKLASIINNVTDSDTATKALTIYRSLEGLMNDISKGDILSIITGSNLNSILTNVLDANSAGEITKVINLVKDAVGTYEALKLVPDILSLLDDFSIPSISQVAAALNCLDLFNKVKNLMKAFSSLGSNKDATNLLENLGRVTQGANSISALDDTNLDAINDTIDEVDLVEVKPLLQFNSNLDSCFRIPKLTIFQSNVTIVEFNNGSLIFSLTNFEILKDNPLVLPRVNDILQIRVSGFIKNGRDYYSLYQTDFQYTPSVYNFIVVDYNIVSNMGVAIFDNSITSVVLENLEGILYEFSTSLIGTALVPDVEDSYILA